jgi:hypothetical protein
LHTQGVEIISPFKSYESRRSFPKGGSEISRQLIVDPKATLVIPFLTKKEKWMLQCAEIRGNLPLPQSNSSGENETVLVEELVETKEKLLQALKLIKEKACN